MFSASILCFEKDLCEKALENSVFGDRSKTALLLFLRKRKALQLFVGLGGGLWERNSGEPYD
jgi:hypothetical protein